MSQNEPLEPLPSEIEQLRARATRCRTFANEYRSDVGTSLTELAVELDGKADRLQAAEDQAALNGADVETKSASSDR
jgi:hypothetical protein